MDRLDLQILRALGAEAWGHRDRRVDATRPAGLARRFGVREELIRDRIGRMEQAGVIAGYEAYPNFHHLGLQATTFHFSLPSDAVEAAVADASSLEGVFGVYGYLGPQVCVDITYRTDPDKRRRLDLLSKLMHGAEPLVMWERNLPTVKRDLDALDWRIIKSLRGHAKRPLEEVAELVGTSVRTARRRFSRLVEEGSIDIIPNVDPTALPGHIAAEVHLRLRDATEASRRRVLAALEDHWFSSWTPPDARVAGLVAMVVVDSVARIDELRSRLAGLDEVLGVELLMPARSAYDGSWIDEAIEERIAALQEAR